MNKPVPPVTGTKLLHWRAAVKRYRAATLIGMGHERALAYVVSGLIIEVPELGRSQARVLTEKAVAWTRTHHLDWLEGRDSA